MEEEEIKSNLKCVMCGEEAKYLADANYLTGVKQEPLCEKCALINLQIEKEKTRRI